MANHKKFFNIILIFQILTVILYYIGPIHYDNPPVTISVLILVGYYIIMLKIGEIIGTKYYFNGRSGPQRKFVFIKLAILVNFIILVISIYLRVGSINLGENLGDAYGQSAERRSSGDSIFEYIRIIFGYLLFGFFPVVLVYWDVLSVKFKIASLLCVGLTILLALGTGVNKYLIDYIIIFIAYQYFYTKKSLIKTFKGWIVIGLILISSISAGIFFTQGQITRYGSSAISGVNPSINSHSDYNISDGSLLVFYSSLSTYLTQGYRAIDLSFKEPFVFTWGVGNSSFLSRQSDRLLGTNFLNLSYPARLERYGWDRYNRWSTFYLWWASDLTYIGVGFLIFGIGFFYSAISNTLTRKLDIASIILMNYLIIALIYLSANNQIMQSGETLVGFFALFIPYIIKRKLCKVKK